MATNAQLQANRLNAQKSTGPRSPEGKAVSRFNALKFGLEARSRVIPGEDSYQLETLTREYHEHLQPANPLEAFLVDSIVAADWNRRRFARIEAQVYHVLIAALDPEDAVASQSPIGAAFHADAVNGKALQSVFRQLDSAGRSFFRNLNELRRLQSGRQESEMMEEMARETPAPQPPAARPELRVEPAATSFNPAIAHPAFASAAFAPSPAYQFGFVPPQPWTPADGVRFVDSNSGTHNPPRRSQA